MLKNAIIAFAFAAVAAAASAQQTLPAPSPIEKEIAARASDVTEVTLNKSMLAFASKFLDSKGKEDEATRQLIQNLDGIYVRDYEFDKDNAVTQEELDKLRSYFTGSEWMSLVHERDRSAHESTDVMVKMVNGESNGMFVLDSDTRDLSLVLILGPIKMNELNKLKGLSGLSSLGALGTLGADVQSKHGKGDK